MVLKKEKGLVFFFTGLSGAGKSTIAECLADFIESQGVPVTLLDGDIVRTHLTKGLGFSREDRDTNILRIGWVSAEIARHSGVVIVAAIAPYEATREKVRCMVTRNNGIFVLVHVATSLEECERRDVKGLYKRVREGKIEHFTGISDPYEEPENCLRLDTIDLSVEQCVDQVLEYMILQIEGSEDEMDGRTDHRN